MVHIGYTMLTGQAGPRELVGHVIRAEEAGFDFSVTSDHHSPWLRSQGHDGVPGPDTFPGRELRFGSAFRLG